jgi:hypothetical protein
VVGLLLLLQTTPPVNALVSGECMLHVHNFPLPCQGSQQDDEKPFHGNPLPEFKGEPLELKV